MMASPTSTAHTPVRLVLADTPDASGVRRAGLLVPPAPSAINRRPVLLMFGAYALFIGGAQVLELVYPNELFPTEIRAAAVGIGSSMTRIGSAAGTWLVPVSLLNYGIGNTMYAAAAVSCIGLLASVWLAPETRGMSLERAASLTR